MILYHGSNEIIEKPKLLASQRPLDFGKGFYTTTNLEQCKVFAQKVLRRRNFGKAIVSFYEIDNNAMHSINILRFDSPNREWLEFITKNRIESTIKNEYDLVIGPVANDDVYNVLLPYFAGNMPIEIALQLLKPKKLFNQYAFCSDKSMSLLHYIKYEEVKL